MRIAGVVTIAVLGVLSCFRPSAADTWDWREVSFGLRLPLTLDRASVFTDVVGLSASSAYPYGSSLNPANDDFLRTPPNEFAIAGTGTGLWVPFESGALITANAWSATFRPPRFGTVTLSYSQSASERAHSHQGDTFRLRSQDFTVGYSRLLTSRIAAGAEFRYTDSQLEFESTAEGLPLNMNGDSRGYDLRVGALAAVTREWLVGVHGGAGWTYSRSNGQIELPEAFGGPLNIGRFHDFTRLTTLRTGVGWRPSESFGAYADAQYIHLKNDDQAVSVVRGLVGLEYLPTTAFALRLGSSIDTAGKTTVSTGLGFYGVKHVQVEVAYSLNAFPEVRREFGIAHLTSASLTVFF